jgi:hypothetical protein
MEGKLFGDVAMNLELRLSVKIHRTCLVLPEQVRCGETRARP